MRALSFTGGKDSILAFFRVRCDDLRFAIAFGPSGIPNFKAHPLELTTKQSAALGLSFLYCPVADTNAHEGRQSVFFPPFSADFEKAANSGF
jgi:diphthamide synthase (EF-2-diphthine--ammonia ligase)